MLKMFMRLVMVALLSFFNNNRSPAVPPLQKEASTKTQDVNNLASSAGDYYATVVILKMTGNPKAYKILPYQMEAASSLFEKLGVKPDQLPVEPGRMNLAQKSEMAVKYLLPEGKSTVAEQLEIKWGADCRRFFNWAIVIRLLEVVDQKEAIITDATLQELVTKYSEKAGLPKALGTPILEALSKPVGKAGRPSYSLVRPLHDGQKRTQFYKSYVLTGEYDVAILADPQFEQKMMSLQNKVDSVAQQKSLTDKLKDARSTEEETMILVKLLHEQNGADGFDIIGKQLRDLGPKAVPTLCRLQGRQHPLDPMGNYQNSAGRVLNMIVYDQKAESVWNGVPPKVLAAWSGTGVMALANCLLDDTTSQIASQTLLDLCRETGGKPIVALQEIHATKMDSGNEKANEAALQVISDWYADQVVYEIGMAVRRGELARSTETQKTMELVTLLGENGVRSLRNVAQRFEEVEEDNTMGKAIRAYLEGAGALKPQTVEARAARAARIANADKLDATQARTIWMSILRKVNFNHPRYAIHKTILDNANINILRYEQEIGTRVTNRYQVPGVIGLIDITMRENARAAGELAGKIAMVSELQRMIDARQATFEIYRMTLEAEVWERATLEHRHALIKHGFIRKENPLRVIVPKRPY